MSNVLIDFKNERPPKFGYLSCLQAKLTSANSVSRNDGNFLELMWHWFQSNRLHRSAENAIVAAVRRPLAVRKAIAVEVLMVRVGVDIAYKKLLPEHFHAHLCGVRDAAKLRKQLRLAQPNQVSSRPELAASELIAAWAEARLSVHSGKLSQRKFTNIDSCCYDFIEATLGVPAMVPIVGEFRNNH